MVYKIKDTLCLEKTGTVSIKAFDDERPFPMLTLNNPFISITYLEVMI
jgi:hypothetical protein